MARRLDAVITDAGGARRRLSAHRMVRLALTALAVAMVAPAAAHADTTRATLSWQAPNTDIDIHAWNAAGTELWFHEKTAIPGLTLSADITHGPGAETITDASTPSTTPLTIGVCYFADYSQTTAAVPTTVTITDAAGGTSTVSPTLNGVGDEQLLTTASGFTPPAGWCKLTPPPGLGAPVGPGAAGPGASATPGTPGSGVAGVQTSAGCRRTSGVAAKMLLASLTCHTAAGVLRTRCATGTKNMLPPAKVFNAAKRAKSAAALRRQTAKKYRPVATALYDLYHAKFLGRGVAGYRKPADLVSKFRRARTSADVMRMLPPMANALRSKDFERVVDDLTKVAGLQRCVAGLMVTVR